MISYPLTREEGRVIPCPCSRCGAGREQVRLVCAQAAAHARDEQIDASLRVARWLVRLERLGLRCLQVWLRVCRAWWWLAALPARFEAWIDAADAELFKRRADTFFAIVFLAIIAVVVSGLFSGLVSIILEGRP